VEKLKKRGQITGEKNADKDAIPITEPDLMESKRFMSEHNTPEASDTEEAESGLCVEPPRLPEDVSAEPDAVAPESDRIDK
jgi:hypothetical protein